MTKIKLCYAELKTIPKSHNADPILILLSRNADQKFNLRDVMLT